MPPIKLEDIQIAQTADEVVATCAIAGIEYVKKYRAVLTPENKPALEEKILRAFNNAAATNG